MITKAVAALLPIATGVALGFLAYELVAESGSPTPEPTQVPTEGVPLADPPQSETPSPEITEARQQIEEDNAKPDFMGEIGDFSIIGKDAGFQYPCGTPEPATSDQVLASDLYFSALDQLEAVAIDSPISGPEAGACGDTVVFIGGDFGPAYVAVFHYFQEQLPVPVDAPRDRLVLADLAGNQALVEVPPQDLVPDCDVFVILRPFGINLPGIALSVQTGDACDQAQVTAQEFASAFAEAIE